MTDRNHGALELWQEKLAFLREEEVQAVEPKLKYSIRKGIEEAEQKIRELGGVPPTAAAAPQREELKTTADTLPTDDRQGTYGKRAAGIAAVVIGTAALYYVLSGDPMADMEDEFRDMGLTPNVGLASHYMPGTVIQLQRGDKVLPRPELLFWPHDCFPDKRPRPSPFYLPSRSGKKATKLQLAGSQVAKFLPSLDMDGAKSWSIVFENPQLLSFAHGDLSEKYSIPCLASLEALVENGTDPAWMRTISESVVASGMKLTVEWQADADTGARSRIPEDLQPNPAAEAVEVGQSINSTGRTVFEIKGQIVLAYKTSSMDFLGWPPTKPE